jgi:hypothetical protein
MRFHPTWLCRAELDAKKLVWTSHELNDAIHGINEPPNRFIKTEQASAHSLIQFLGAAQKRAMAAEGRALTRSESDPIAG